MPYSLRNIRRDVGPNAYCQGNTSSIIMSNTVLANQVCLERTNQYVVSAINTSTTLRMESLSYQQQQYDCIGIDSMLSSI